MEPSPRAWRVLGSQVLLSVPPWLTIEREQVELPSGRVLSDFYRIQSPDFVTIVPLTARGDLVFVRGYKHGVRRETLSVPAGLMDPGETPLAAAQRELLEETGYTAPTWESLGSFVVDGNRGNGTMHAFLARAAHCVTTPKDDDTEELQVECLSRAQAVQALRDGAFATLAGAATLSLALTLLAAPAPV